MQTGSSDSRQSEGDQSSHHHNEVEDVPHVSEIRAVVQNETLVYHLRDKHVATRTQSRFSAERL